MSSTTANISSAELQRAREDLWASLKDIDARLKETYVPPHFRITTSSTSNQRTFSTNGHEMPSSTVTRSRVSSSSHDEHNTSLPENSYEESLSSSKSLNSSIVPTNKIIKTKDDLISLVNRDQQSTGRNRRMFGVLLGTLNKFKAEASAYNEQSIGLKRQEIEKRLEEKQAKEREDKQHERTELLATKKTCQQKLKLVNMKLEIMQRMATHEKFYSPLRNFIRTKTKPYVFYMPKGSMDEIFDKKLQESQNEIDKELEEFKRDCQRELDLLDDTTNMNDDETNSSKKRKLSEHDDNDIDDDDDDDDALADLPDEITLSAPEMKSEIGNTTINSTFEQSNNNNTNTSVPTKSTRTVIYDEIKASNQQDDQSMIDE